MAAVNHKDNLAKLCRVCGMLLARDNRNNFTVTNEKVKERLKKYLFIFSGKN